MALKNNTWKVNQWYDQAVAGNVEYSSSNNNLWTWGDNEYGSLGQNIPRLTDKSSPTQIPGATNWSSLGGGFYATQSSGAVRSDGTLWTWGRNYNGVLGHNQAIAQKDQVSSPVQVPGTTWSQISVRSDNMMAIKTDGTLWGWGDAGGGETATNTEGTAGTRSSPTQVPGTTWSSLGSYWGGYGAVKTDGTLWMWGKGSGGRLAQNSQVEYSSPVQVGSDTDWLKMSRDCHELGISAIKTDGTLWIWGANGYGALGQNSPENYKIKDQANVQHYHHQFKYLVHGYILIINTILLELRLMELYGGGVIMNMVKEDKIIECNIHLQFK